MAIPHFVKSSKIDYPEVGIVKGDSYWWWRFGSGQKRISKQKPKPSMLTSSPFIHNIYFVKERIEELTINDDLNEERNGIVTDLEVLRDECNERLNAMSYRDQESDAALLLRERSDCVQEMIDEFESIDLNFDNETSDDEMEAGLNAMKNVDYTGG